MQTESRKREPQLLMLNKFAGTWNTAGAMRRAPGQPPVAFYGADTYKWVPGGYFLLHEVDVMMGTNKVQSIEVIGFDAASGTYPMHSYDNTGQTGTMHGRFESANTWLIESDQLRFRGTFSDDGHVLSGVWEERDADEWKHLMDIRLEKEV